MSTPSNFRDLTNQRFGNLMVLRRIPRESKRWEVFWECKCDCGNEKIVLSARITSGHTKSCGCLKTSHQMSETKEFHTWEGMIQRCTNQKSASYKKYGARGIKVCDRWLNSFELFFADMGPAPSRQHSIDRHPDRAGNYEPSNARWATIEEQNNNRSCNRRVIYRGHHLTLADALDRSGRVISREVAYDRIVRLGWAVDAALDTPMAAGASRKHAKRSTAPVTARGEVRI